MILLIQFFILLLHPFHASVCDIRYNDSDQRLEISHRIFLDDLENAIRDEYDTRIDIMVPKEPEEVKKYVERYLKDHFSVYIGKKEVFWSFLGYEIEEDVMWCYLESSTIEWKNEISIKNTILTSLFRDQDNIHHVHVQNKIKSLHLTSRKVEGRLQF